jgi:excisionase family DNA binding protein
MGWFVLQRVGALHNIRALATTTPGSNMETTTPKLYRIHAVMDQLSISRTTVYRLVNQGKLKLVKIGTRSSGITADSLNALVAGNATT